MTCLEVREQHTGTQVTRGWHSPASMLKGNYERFLECHNGSCHSHRRPTISYCLLTLIWYNPSSSRYFGNDLAIGSRKRQAASQRCWLITKTKMKTETTKGPVVNAATCMRSPGSQSAHFEQRVWTGRFLTTVHGGSGQASFCNLDPCTGSCPWRGTFILVFFLICLCSPKIQCVMYGH